MPEELTDKDVQELIKPDKLAEALRTIKGQPFSLKQRPYLRAIYRQFQVKKPNKVVWLSSRKIEKTETIVNLLLYGMLAIDYFSALYTIARQVQVSDFSNKRMATAINTSLGDTIFKKLKQPTSVTHKEFYCDPDGKYYNHLYMYSAWGDAVSIIGHDDDFVAVDEYQDMETDIFPMLNEIITGSQHKWFLAAGTARDEGDELHTLFLQSTMNEWHVTCPYCKHEQIPGWENIMGVEGKKYKGCISCKREIKMYRGEWKPTAKEPEKCLFVGFHTNQIMHPDITANEIYIKYKAYKSDRKFNNEVLGLPFSGGFRPITKEMVLKCYRDKDGKPNKFNYTARDKSEGNVLGMDCGKGHHITIMNKKQRILYQEVVDTTNYRSFTEIINHIKKLFEWFEIEKAVIDFGYGQNEVKELQSFYGDMVWGCRYAKGDIDNWYEFKEEDEEGNLIYRLNVNRSRAIELAITAFSRQEIIIPGAESSRAMAEGTFDHYTNLTSDISTKLDEGKRDYRKFKASEPYTRYGRSGPDHFLHSVVYCLLALHEEDDGEFLFGMIK